MNARHWSMALVLALVAVPAAAETAKTRGSSSDERSVGSRHHSSSPSRPAPPSAVSRGSGSGSPPATEAQGRHPRAGSGHGFRSPSGRRYYPYSYSYYSPYRFYGYGYGGFPYFDLYYGSGSYGWPYYYGGPYAGGYYSRYGYRGDYGSVRVLVDPSETRVYVDGSYAGMADEYDGLFQRLHVSPGRHELTLKLDGYQTHRMRVYVPYDGTLKLHHDMARGQGDESFEDLAGDRGAEGPRADLRERYDGARDDDADERYSPRDERRPARDERTGTLQLDVLPEGASIYVDGVFRGTGRSLRRLELSAGSHRVEILHPGMRTFERDVNVEEGESEDLEIELER